MLDKVANNWFLVGPARPSQLHDLIDVLVVFFLLDVQVMVDDTKYLQLKFNQNFGWNTNSVLEFFVVIEPVPFGVEMARLFVVFDC